MDYDRNITEVDLNTDGSISRKENGTVEYKLRYYDEFDVKKRKSFTGPDVETCKQRAKEFLDKLNKKKGGIDLDATIPDILHEKCKSDYEKNYVHAQGYNRNLYSISIIEKGVIGHIPIVDLTSHQIDYFLRTLTHYANSTISKVHSMMKKAYDIAISKGIVSYNLMLLDELRCPKSYKPNKKVYALTVEEENRLINFVSDYKPPYGRNSYVDQILISLYTGMRMGEVNALKPENIDFKKGFIKIRGTISRGLDYQDFLNEKTKTSAGVRDVPIPDVLVPILKDALQNQKPNPYGLIFYDNRHDKMISTEEVNDFFKRACVKCDIEPRGQHSLRHTFATRCVEAHIDYNVLKTWLGHTNIHITLDTYANVYENMSQESSTDLQKYMDSIREHCA